MPIDLQPLLAPLPGDQPAGADISFSDCYDQIREARRADDAQLDQGDWQIDLKVADWRLAAELATRALSEQSKDLQVAAWLSEAWIHRHGLVGAAHGFTLLEGLVTQYWDTLYPPLDDGDAEERAAKLAWLNLYGSAALRQLPLGSAGSPTSLNDWQSSREVDNLGRQQRDAYEAALADGKQTGEAYDQALAEAGAAHLRAQVEAATEAATAFAALQATTDRLFGADAPSLQALEDALKRVQMVLSRAGLSMGIAPAPAAPAGASEPVSPAAPATMASATATPLAGGGLVLNLQGGHDAAKAGALKALAEIAGFFRRTEPHSPVTSLLERAIAWADMPLDQWLQEVVRDDSVLAAIRDRTGMARTED